jgi:hypothetical protein
MVQRNKLLFLGIAIIAVLLVTSLVILSTLLVRERQAREQSQLVTPLMEEIVNGVGDSLARGEDVRTNLQNILDSVASCACTSRSAIPRRWLSACEMPSSRPAASASALFPVHEKALMLPDQ